MMACSGLTLKRNLASSTPMKPQLWLARENGKAAWFVVIPDTNTPPPTRLTEKFNIADCAKILVSGWGRAAPREILLHYGLA